MHEKNFLHAHARERFLHTREKTARMKKIEEKRRKKRMLKDSGRGFHQSTPMEEKRREEAEET